MKSKGYTTLDLVILLAVTGIAAIVFLVKTSYAFTDNSQQNYEDIINLMLKQAEKYGENSEILKEEKVEYVSINDLIEAGYVGANDDGKIVDPRNKEEDLNSLKIKIKLDEDSGEITATLEK